MAHSSPVGRAHRVYSFKPEGDNDDGLALMKQRKDGTRDRAGALTFRRREEVNSSVLDDPFVLRLEEEEEEEEEMEEEEMEEDTYRRASPANKRRRLRRPSQDSDISSLSGTETGDRGKIELVVPEIDEQELQQLKHENELRQRKGHGVLFEAEAQAETNEVAVEATLEQREIVHDNPKAKTRQFTPRTKEKQGRLEEVLQKGANRCTKHKLPPILLADELVEKIQKHLSRAGDILSGRVPSLYYNNARSAHSASSRAILSVDEFRTLDLRDFTAGFYGLKRQMRVSVEVLHEYKEQLANNGNPVVKWWGPTDFAQYVLAPEVLSALCQEEMGLETMDDAWDVMEDTTEFGLAVADKEPLEAWELPLEQERLRQDPNP